MTGTQWWGHCEFYIVKTHLYLFYRKGSTCTLKIVGLLWVNLQPEYHPNSWLRRNAQWLWYFWNPHSLPPSLLPPSQRTEEEEKNTSTISYYIRDQTALLNRVASLSFGIIDCLFSFLYSLLAEDKMVGRSLSGFSDCWLSEPIPN